MNKKFIKITVSFFWSTACETILNRHKWQVFSFQMSPRSPKIPIRKYVKEIKITWGIFDNSIPQTPKNLTCKQTD
jgi:hypothetical protein